MDNPFLRPSSDLNRSAEEMLSDLERLNDATLLKLEQAPDATRTRYDRELRPRLEEIRRLVAQRSIIAKNAIEDAITMLREIAITAATPNVT
jgi:hypothetical protein